MYSLCILLIVLGAGIMIYNIVKYYEYLLQLKAQIHARTLFSNYVYIACFIMMLFFLIGYVINLNVYLLATEINAQDVFIAVIFFFGSVFITTMVKMIRRMFLSVADKAELKKQLQQQELMSAISQSFTTTEDPKKLICEALKMVGEFMHVKHVFLSQYIKETNVLECIYQWSDESEDAAISSDDKWVFVPEVDYYKNLINENYAATSNYKILSSPHLETVKNHHLGAFMNFSISISGKFWGVLGFVTDETSHTWNESYVHLGKLIAGIFSGVIARNTANKELLRAKEAAETASMSKSQFLSRMSHEMRTPMNAIIGMTTIGKSSDETERKDYCFEKIKAASSHLLGVINDILDMSKIEANKLELSHSKFNLENVLSRIINFVSCQMEEKKQSFSLTVADDVPQTIGCDEQRLSQVLTNLLSNAHKFTPAGGEISLFVRKEQGFNDSKLSEGNGFFSLEFEVKDTGIGISPEQQEKLFRSFEQADGSISRKYGGTGLGLVISKCLVEMMGGTMKVDSEINVGTSFVFNIRAEMVLQDNTGEQLVVSTETEPAYEKDCFKGRKILVAEDIEINREIVESLLEYTGVSIDFAENGREAYERFSANPDAYDVVFMDIHMPDIDGYEATKMIRELDNPHARTVPIIAMTADVFREDIEKCISSGMNDHIGKPLNVKDMLGKIACYG